MLLSRKELAEKLLDIGYNKSDILIDYHEETHMTVLDIYDSLGTERDTVYLLETFLQFCDGSQEEEDHKMFFEASMDIVHYLENFEKGE